MKYTLLHDWTLVRVTFDWQPSRVSIELEDSSCNRKTLTAEGVRELRVPKLNEWGTSISVNEVTEIEAPSGNGRCLHIEMQSGDVICIEAEHIMVPAA